MVDTDVTADVVTGAPEEPDFDELDRRCDRFLNGHGRRGAGEFLSEIAPDTQLDRYGDSGVVAELEEEIVRLLGKEAALFVPSGTMAQQAILRVHAEHLGRRTLVWHPACHLDQHEDRAYERLHRLSGVPVGSIRQPLSRKELDRIAAPPAALVIELPQRHLGGHLPEWEDLVDQTEWARSHGAAVHLDGARIWGCTSYYERTLAQICALFDTVYVSFYKGLGGLAGCAVAGPADVIAEAREWRHRHGGTLFSMWPNAASALFSLHNRLPRMESYVAHAGAIARALAAIPGVSVLPDPPPTEMMHFLVPARRRAWRAAVARMAEERSVMTWSHPWDCDVPGLQRIELSVGEAVMGFEPGEVRAIVEQLIEWASE
jgi:threonine aldolase